MSTGLRWNKRRGRGFTLVELLVVIAIIGILIALLLPAVQAAREAARKLQCSNHLKQIGLAVLTYEAQFTVFPITIANYQEKDPDGNELDVDGNGLTWMIGILPFLDQGALFDSINLDGQGDKDLGIERPENRPAVATSLSTYYCPSDSTKGTVDKGFDGTRPADFEFATSNYTGVMGPHDYQNSSIWGGLPDCQSYSAYGFKECSGTFWRHSHLAPPTISSFTDGTSNTIIVGEVIPEYYPWLHWAVSSDVFQPTHASINYIDTDPTAPWRNTASFTSRHPGGVQFLFGDGHVNFFNDEIDTEVYRGLSTRAGGEVVQVPE